MFIELIRKRRSIRKYQDKQLEAEKVEQLVEAALRSPSSRGINPWELVVVTDQSLLKKLSMAKPHGAAFLAGAPLGIVVCGSPEKSDVWIEDCSIVSTFIQLTAESMGLGNCWIQIRNRKHDKELSAEAYISEVLGIPQNLKVESIIAVGYPAETKPPHKKETLQYEKVHSEQHGTR